jgi:hypothetical protein
MSLVAFHRVLILTAIVFCLGFAAWELRAYLQLEAGGGALALAGLFGGLAVLLAGYLARLRSILRLED